MLRSPQVHRLHSQRAIATIVHTAKSPKFRANVSICFVSLYLRFAVFDEARLWGVDGQLRSQVAFRAVQKPQIANERKQN